MNDFGISITLIKTPVIYQSILLIVSSSIASGTCSQIRTTPGAFRLQERLDVDLQSADRVLEFVIFQHSRVKNTEGTNYMLLAADAGVD